MKKVVDISHYQEKNIRKLAKDIEEKIGAEQLAVLKEQPMLPNWILMTNKQRQALKKAHKIKNLGFGDVYITKHNVMEVEVVTS
jgi:hypothetical protein